MTKEQQDDKDTIELGMLSIMQMHSNETGTEVAKNWKDTFTDIYTLHTQEYQKLIDSGIFQTEQENKETTEDVESDDDYEDSDEDDSDYVETNKRRERFSLFVDEEESDEPGTQNTLGNESGQEKIVGNENQDVVATDNETTESGKAATKDICNKSKTDEPGTQNTLGNESGHGKIVRNESLDVVATDNETTESGKAGTKDVGDTLNHESATTNKSDTAGNNKRAAEENLEVEKGKKSKKKAALERDNDGVKYRIITRKGDRNLFI